MSLSTSELLQKYDIPAPRYTSYPTVPYWSENPTPTQWLQHLQAAARNPNCSWSLYIHIPYCESLCTFCGCNTSITKDHKREDPYVAFILGEWQSYSERVADLKSRTLKNIHLGGGTPTFLSANNLRRLLEPLLASTRRDQDFQGSIEVDPRRTSFEQLKVLRDLGFQRVSMGVQDFNSEVQRLINRHQPLEMTQKLTGQARELGYQSVNYDLIYGLPRQTPQSIRQTIEQTVKLRPDRIAFYSFALVPWIKPAQRLFKDEDIPTGAAKRQLYEIGREIFLQEGYTEIGMDHFALSSDSLTMAAEGRRLHRNFMGYTDQRTEILLGLGVSSISETPTCFHQNEKVLPVYERRIQAGEIPTLRGHLLSLEDQYYREQILKLMTEWEVLLKDERQEQDLRHYLHPMLEDGLIEIKQSRLRLLPAGKPFLRNACMGLDMRMREKAPEAKVFSQAL